MDGNERSDEMVSSRDIEDLHSTFMLFGNPNSPFWFIGLEEGNHPTENQSIDSFVLGLVSKTRRYNENKMSSLRDFCGDGSDYLPNDERDAVYQRTWGGYIKLLLSLHDTRRGISQPWSLADVKDYQKTHLGELRVPANVPMSCLGELYPMHRKGRGGSKWPYKPLVRNNSLSFFKSCASYRKLWTSKRAKLLCEKIRKHQPEFVFCFGADLRNELSRAESGIKEIKLIGQLDGPPVLMGLVGSTRVVFSYHPTAKGMKDQYWRNLGHSLANLTGSKDHLRAA